MIPRATSLLEQVAPEVAAVTHAVSVVGTDFKPIQVEALLLFLLAFLGVQEAWFVSMTPAKQSR